MNESNRRVYNPNGICPTITTMQGGGQEPKICAMRGRPIENPKSRQSGLETHQVLEIKYDGTSNTITTVQKDNLVLDFIIGGTQKNSYKGDGSISSTLPSAMGEGGGHIPMIGLQTQIRKLTPLECWRLMGFDDIDHEKAKNAGVSDSQRYKQAGNSIVVDVLAAIFQEML